MLLRTLFSIKPFTLIHCWPVSHLTSTGRSISPYRSVPMFRKLLLETWTAFAMDTPVALIQTEFSVRFLNIKFNE